MALNAQAGRAAGPLGARGASGWPPRRGARARGRGAGRSCGAARAAGAARRPLRAGGGADRQRAARREDQRPAGVARRPGRAADPQGQARQADRVRLRRPDRRGHREHPPRRARAASCRPPHAPGSPGENTLLHRPRPSSSASGCGRGGRLRRRLRPPQVRAQLARPRTDGCSSRAASEPARAHPPAAAPLPHRQRGPDRHLKRRYGLRRSRLRGAEGQRTWTGWAILAYNLDTVAIRPG